MNPIKLIWGWFFSQGLAPGFGDDHLLGEVMVSPALQGEVTVTPSLLGHLSLRESTEGEVEVR